MSIMERLKEYIDFKGISISSFERNTGMSNASFGKSLKTGGAIGTDKLENILSVYTDISTTWLLTGHGDMLLTNHSPKGYTTKETLIKEHLIGDEEPAIYGNQTRIGLPYYDVDFLGGFNEVFNDQGAAPAYYIDFKPFNHADFWCNLSGDSMSPRLNHGDIIALKRCTLEAVQYGEIYAVVMEELRTVKVLRKGKDTKHLRFIPLNLECYDEKEYHIANILHIFKVVGSVHPNF